MHVEDNDLKALIDCVAMRLDDEMDTLGEDLDVRRVLDDRDDVRIIWSLTDLLENLRQEQRSRRRGYASTNVGLGEFAGMHAAGVPEGAQNVAIGVETIGGEVEREVKRVQGVQGDLTAAVTDAIQLITDVHDKLWARMAKLEALVGEHEETRMEHHTKLNVHGKTHDAHNDTLETLSRRLNALDDRFPDTKFWGRIQHFERGVKRSLQDVARVVEGLQEKLQALELQGDDRWVRMQQRFGGVNELRSMIEEHVGETGTRH